MTKKLFWKQLNKMELALEYASENLKNDKEVVLEAVK
jgi:hypothetical protein